MAETTFRRKKARPAQPALAPSLRPARKAREMEHGRRDILEAAASAFARRGFHATTMEEIARAAGYAVGSLYTHFPGKEAILHALLETVSTEIEEIAARPLPASLSYRQRFEMGLYLQFEMLEQQRDLVLPFMSQRWIADWGLGSEIGAIVRQIYWGQIERLASQVEEGMQQGQLRGRSPRLVAQFVIDVVYGAIAAWGTGETSGSLRERVPELMDLIFNGIGASKEDLP